MNPRFLISTLIIALLSIIFRDSLYHGLKRASALSTAIKPALRGISKGIYESPETENMGLLREIRKSFLAIEQSEGAGARVRRAIGGPQLRNFSPFLLLDHFHTTSLAGFPDHPHRGQGEQLILMQSFTCACTKVEFRNYHLSLEWRNRP
jgi:hypothetical protein